MAWSLGSVMTTTRSARVPPPPPHLVLADPSRAASTTSAGIRSWASTCPADPRTASAKRSAQVFSHTIMAADVSFGRSAATSSTSASLTSPPDLALEDSKAWATSESRSPSSNQPTSPDGVLGHEQQVEEPNDAVLDQFGQRRHDVAVELVAGELDHDVFDGCVMDGDSRTERPVGRRQAAAIAADAADSVGAMSILGHRVLRREDPALLTTGGTYVDDLDLPDAAFVTYVRSTMAHARADRRRRRARPVPCPACWPWSPPPISTWPTWAPAMPMFNAAMTRPLLARDIVRFVGEPIVAIVTETRAQGPDAAETVFVDYEPLPTLVDPVARHRRRDRPVRRGRHQRGVDARPLRRPRRLLGLRGGGDPGDGQPAPGAQPHRGAVGRGVVGRRTASSSTSPARAPTPSATPSPRCTGSRGRWHISHVHSSQVPNINA